jgi:hypothetical protein
MYQILLNIMPMPPCLKSWHLREEENEAINKKLIIYHGGNLTD